MNRFLKEVIEELKKEHSERPDLPTVARKCSVVKDRKIEATEEFPGAVQDKLHFKQNWYEFWVEMRS